MRVPRRAWLLAVPLFLSSCPASSPEVRTGPRPPALADRALPALALAPRAAAYFGAVRRLSSLIEGARALVETMRALDSSLTAERLDQQLRAELGLSPLQSLEVEDAGLDPAGDAAVFSTGISPTFAFKIGDEDRLTKFIAGRTKSLTTYVRSHRGVAVTSWSSSSTIRGSVLRLQGYLLVHFEHAPGAGTVAAPGRAPVKTPTRTKPDPGLGWLDQILEAAETGSGPAALSTVLAAAGDRRDLLLHVDPEPVARAAAATVVGRDKACATGDAELTKARRLMLGVGLRPRALRATLLLELDAAAAKALWTQLGDGPRLPSSLWDQAPARVEWQLDLLRLTDWTRPFVQACGSAPGLLGSLAQRLRSSIEPYRSVLDHAGRGLSAALLAADEKGQGTLHLRGAILGRVPGPADRAYLERQLPLAPGEEKVGRRAVRRVSSSLTLAEPVQVLVGDGLLRLASGDGVMEKLLGAPRQAPRGQGVFHLELEPGKLADLRAALKLVDEPPAPAAALPYWHGRRRSRSEELDQMAAWLSSFSRLKLSAGLTSGSLRVEGEYGLR